MKLQIDSLLSLLLTVLPSGGLTGLNGGEALFSYTNHVEDAKSVLPMFVSQAFENKNVDASWFHLRLQLKANRRSAKFLSISFLRRYNFVHYSFSLIP